jgi:hypothetical protein
LKKKAKFDEYQRTLPKQSTLAPTKLRLKITQMKKKEVGNGKA